MSDFSDTGSSMQTTSPDYIGDPTKAVDFKIFATQSTHKVLSALSQCSMVHARNVKTDQFFADHFNNSFMMNTSTSPQYTMIASLDVATAVMDISGRSMLHETLKEALQFRVQMEVIRMEHENHISGKGKNPQLANSKRWWFKVWQPPNVHASRWSELKKPSFWVLPPSNQPNWHHFENIEENQVMLDPVKVTILTTDMGPEKLKFPAAIVSRFLESRGIVPEKTGFYSLLLLFTIGVTRGKSGALLAELHHFKRLYDHSALACDVFPKLDPDFYGSKTLKELCSEMAKSIAHAEKLLNEVMSTIPRQAMTPNEAYTMFNSHKIDWVPVDQLEGRVSAVLIVPYPPGIPMIMPGEIIEGKAFELLNEYLRLWQLFPSFETEIHGLTIKTDPNVRGKLLYFVACTKVNEPIPLQQERERKEE